MKRIVLVAVMFSTMPLLVGCVGKKLDEKMVQYRTIKYEADKAFTLTVRKAIDLAEGGWKKKHELQRTIFENVYADRVRRHTVGFVEDENGVPTGGQIDLAIMHTIETQRRKEEIAYLQSVRDTKIAINKARDALRAYAIANEATYKLETDAQEAKRAAQAQLQAALEAIGALTAAVVGAFIAG